MPGRSVCIACRYPSTKRRCELAEAGASGIADRERVEIGSVQILTDEPAGAEKQIVLSLARIQELVNGTFINDGFVIALDGEPDDRLDYNSSDSAAASQRPVLVIQSTLP